MTPRLILCALLLTSCRLTNPHSDILPYIVKMTTAVGAPASVGTPMNAAVGADVLMDSSANFTSLSYDLELGVCVFEGAVAYSDAVARACLAQQALPTTVALSPGAARSTFWSDKNNRGESRSFSFSTNLMFAKPGTYTVLGFGKSWYGSRERALGPAITVVDRTPRVITVN
ncbi:hypothetical protein [Deinococcus multiflagellatus]|uniref:Uncharacterized protein n=1 Tax=Deinococcus multiflagellatus TaxID=1656887 RepID=A0ABW1ZKR9_9DEIO|nr:hypothetical protein [Deinococcus multiflagellatus]MBZ9713064.1 hypothetical protein [Deinococcus multiflagellatus]